MWICGCDLGDRRRSASATVAIGGGNGAKLAEGRPEMGGTALVVSFEFPAETLAG